LSGYSVALGGVGNFAQEKGEGVDVCQRDGRNRGHGAQKSPQGLRRAGFQDFISRLW
jgi:hypothetical protein